MFCCEGLAGQSRLQRERERKEEENGPCPALMEQLMYSPVPFVEGPVVTTRLGEGRWGMRKRRLKQ